MRQLTPKLIAPILKRTRYRFDKSWRHGDTLAKRFVYDYMLDTVKANTLAGLGFNEYLELYFPSK